jgi:hypothetical protein
MEAAGVDEFLFEGRDRMEVSPLEVEVKRVVLVFHQR